MRAQRTVSSSRARAVAATQEAAQQVKDELARDAASDEQMAYVVALDELFARRQAEYATAAARSEQATTEAVRRLARVKPPASVIAEHDALRNALSAHLDDVHALIESSQAADPERVADAAARLEVFVAFLRDVVRQLTDTLDYYTRWPAPAASSTGSDQSSHHSAHA